jgi:predicted transcriptional regulator
MSLILQLDAEIEHRLYEQAAASGKAPETIALEAIAEKLSAADMPFRTLSVAEWKTQLEALLASTPLTTATFVDDRREAIYAQRGE